MAPSSFLLLWRHDLSFLNERNAILVVIWSLPPGQLADAAATHDRMENGGHDDEHVLQITG